MSARNLNISLWAAQILLAMMLGAAGYMKVTSPVTSLGSGGMQKRRLWLEYWWHALSRLAERCPQSADPREVTGLDYRRRPAPEPSASRHLGGKAGAHAAAARWSSALGKSATGRSCASATAPACGRCTSFGDEDAVPPAESHTRASP